MTIERENLVRNLSRITDRIVAKVPDEALPLFVSKEAVKSTIRNTIEKVPTEQLLDVTLLAYDDLQQLFADLSKDWMMTRIGMLKASEFPLTRKVLEEKGVSWFT